MKIIRKCNRWYFVDKGLGAIIGAAIGVCAVFAVVLLVYTVFQLVIVYDSSSGIMNVYQNSVIFKFVNDFNVLGKISSLVP